MRATHSRNMNEYEMAGESTEVLTAATILPAARVNQSG